jgi:hypothetical protein
VERSVIRDPRNVLYRYVKILCAASESQCVLLPLVNGRREASPMTEHGHLAEHMLERTYRLELHFLIIIIIKAVDLPISRRMNRIDSIVRRAQRNTAGRYVTLFR